MASTASRTPRTADEDAAEKHLLRHVNEVRKHANLDTLDAFLTQSGYSWIEMMVSHAKDSYDSYTTSSLDADSTLAHAFEHRMAAELLKTPSPKKKRVKAVLPVLSADPFTDDDKENASITSPLKAKKAEREKETDPKSQVAPLENNTDKITRSKTDRSQLPQLANPFEKRALQVKSSAKKADGNVVAPSGKELKPAASIRGVETTANKAPTLPHLFDDDSREVEYSLLAVGDTTRGATLKGNSNALAVQPEEDTTPSPRESTPPPLSPAKTDRAEASMWARKRLDESLLRLDSDEEDETVDVADVVPRVEAQADQTPQRGATAKDSAPPTEDLPKVYNEARVSGGDHSKADGSKPAPKRTLSSMAHAKKSLANISTKQSARSSSMAPSSHAAVKGSFLSKSILRAELDHQSFDESADLLPFEGKRDSAVDVASKKRKSDENVSEQKAKSVKIDAIHTADIGREEEKATTVDADRGSVLQPQSLREKIESFNTNKSSAGTVTTPPSSSSASSGLSTMLTHQVGVGAAKIASPIFSRTNSTNTLHAEPDSPSSLSKTGKATTKEFEQKEKAAIKESESGDLGKRPVTTESKDQAPFPSTTTPLNSPGPKAYALYPKIATASTVPAEPVAKVAQSKQQAESPSKKRTTPISIDDTSVSDLAVYDTDSDGDLSLVDLVNEAKGVAQASAPRPPGATARVMPAPPKTRVVEKFAPVHGASTSKAPTSSTLGSARDINRSPSRLATASSIASTSSGSSASSNNHATWGGSISSKLKGILGFSSSTSGPSPTSAADPIVKSYIGVPPKQPASVPTRKDSFASGNGLGRNAPAPAPTAKSAAMARQKEAEAKAKQSEERTKAQSQSNVEAARKRAREEAVAAAKAVAVKAGATASTKSTQQKQPTAAPESKKRKSNEGAAVPVSQSKATIPVPTNAVKVGSTFLNTSTIKASATKPGAQTLPKSLVKSSDKPSVNAVFSDHNPFQRAQQQQQQQALAAVAQQMQRHNANPSNAALAAASKANLSPNSKMKVANTAHIELEEPDSAYSDSEDEDTIRRRMQHKPWETREGLAQALEAQSTVDADMIFGIPQGGVPLDDILPAQTENARVRRMRPRSSSATWSRDGLKQFEIDRYNERMGIAGPGVQLGIAPRDDAGRSPSRVGRMSALAQSAIAQGHVTSSLQKKTSQAFR